MTKLQLRTIHNLGRLLATHAYLDDSEDSIDAMAYAADPRSVLSLPDQSEITASDCNWQEHRTIRALSASLANELRNARVPEPDVAVFLAGYYGQLCDMRDQIAYGYSYV